MKNILCKLGIHIWEKEVPESQRELVREFGYVGFVSFGIQKGWQSCRYCPCRRKVYRQGLISWGGSRAGPWRALYPTKEDFIDSMPTL